MLTRTIIAFVAALGLAHVDAATPKQTAAFGIALDATPQTVRAFLAANYKPCNPSRSVYRQRPGVAVEEIAALEINPGLSAHDPSSRGLCTHSQAGDGMIDAIEARFTHPDADPNQPLYSLEVQRIYPDIVHAKPPRLRLSFAELRADLLRTYGKPLEETRERRASTSANFATSLGIGNDVKRDDYVVRFLWAEKGRLTDAGYQESPCECAGRYVKAVVEISRSPVTIPRNTFYVLSLKLLVEDPDLRDRQMQWNAQSRPPRP